MASVTRRGVNHPDRRQDRRAGREDCVRTRPGCRAGSDTRLMLLARPGPTHSLPRRATQGIAPITTAMAGGLGFGVGIVVTLVAALLGAWDAPLLGLALLAATAAATAATTTIGGALAAAAPCWALWNGFLVNDLGQLTFTTADLHGLIAIAAPAVVVAVLSTARRHVARCGAGRWSAGEPPDAEVRTWWPVARGRPRR